MRRRTIQRMALQKGYQFSRDPGTAPAARNAAIEPAGGPGAPLWQRRDTGTMIRTRAQAFDDYLVAAARTGDRKAFGLLARRWQGRLLAHAWRLTGEVELAREAAQDGWIEIVRGLGRLRDDQAFAAWAYQIVSRRCARRIGQARRGRALVAAVAIEAEPALGTVTGDGAVATPALARALAALPPEQRAAVALFHLEDMSIAETAIALNVPAGTVKTRLMHARRKLRAALEGDL
jgi:RNA polymerase sigma factor (sigma-70 family)